MADEGFKRKLTAILSADVIGYSRLMRDDEEATVRDLATRRVLITEIIQQHNGRVVDSPGDNILAEFASVVDAVNGAIKIQQEIKRSNTETPEDRRMEFRIGINLGDVIEEEERIYGDGVNIAARVEGLAAGGGIAISGTVYEHIKDKLSLGYHYLGEQDVKNISEPVRVYRLLTEPADAGKMIGKEKSKSKSLRWAASAAIALIALVIGAFAIWNYYFRPSFEPASADKMAFQLPDKPSIAVLPFTNMSDDSKQDYFADGIAEDLITDLSKMSGLFVIARNSTFVYKGKSVKIRKVAEELGVRYVLQGSLRKAGEQVRINTQLIDATTGNHLWANRFDGKLENIFALQDKITQKIVVALAVKLSEGEQQKVNRKETDNIEAYDAFLKGWEHYRRWTPEGFRKAIPYFEKAIELDSKYGRAYAAIASVYTEGYQRAWDWSHFLGVSAEAMPGLAGKYLKEALNNPTPLAHQVASKWYIIIRFPEEAIAEAERAIALDPNDAAGYTAMAEALIYSGRPGEAIDFVNKAMRLDPHNISNYLYTLGLSYFGMEQFQEALSFFERAFKLNPEIGLVQRAYIAATYVHLGQEKKAMVELDKLSINEVKELYDVYVKYEGNYYKNSKDRARLIESLHKIELDRGK
jgi:adenylate cyclase